MKRRISDKLAQFAADEGGFATHFALTVLVLLILFSGLSVDTTNAWRVRAVLQIATDAAAEAGVMDLPNENAAMTSALKLAGDNLSEISSTMAVTSSNVEFGSWNTDNRKFTANATPTNAIRVTAVRSRSNSNPVPTFFLRLAGLTSWDVAAQSVAYRSSTDCATADISTKGKFDLTSNNDFYNGFCVAAKGGVEMNNNNQFDDNNIIYVKRLDDVDLPGSSSMATVVGRGTANSSASLTYGDVFQVKSDIATPYTTDISALASNYLDPLYSGQPDYINTAAAVIRLDARDVKYTSFIPGRIYEVQCGGSAGSKAQFYNGAEISKIVMVSDCKIQLGKGSSFENVVLVSKSTSSKSVYAAAKVRLGADDDCAVGGGVSIYTAGGFKSASKLKAYGAYISAVKKVKVAAQNDSIAGIRIDAGGDVSFSAQASFGSCKNSASASDVAYLLVK